ncbi:hypothetical protein LBMAG49_17470 [Planctomycetota bacterium]|nr:hypothetical protein LBMAG49_17470 [Planctomycetota bacterium]
MDEGDKGKGRVVLLDLIDGARILVAPARALPQRFFMTTKITEECRFQPVANGPPLCKGLAGCAAGRVFRRVGLP